MIRLLAVFTFLSAVARVEAAPALDDAEQALAEGIPQVAIVKLQGALKKSGLTAADRENARWLLAEAQLGAGYPAEALAIVAELPERPDTASQLLRANIETASRQWGNAFRRYQELSTRPDAP